MLCVVIPTLNATHSPRYAALLGQVRGWVDDLVIADGGSTDETLALALDFGARLAVGGAGRGVQLARGARWAQAQGETDWLLFLHADTRLPLGWREAAGRHMDTYPDRAAYFRFALDDEGFWPSMVAFWVRLRCYWLALPYGDQGLLIRRDHYRRAGGYPRWPLFEDVQIVRAIGRRGLRALPLTLVTDAGKYQRDGYRKRTFSNLGLLIKFLMRGRPDILARQYK